MSRSNENEPGTFLYLDDRVVPVLETLDGFVLKVLLLIARETYRGRFPSYRDLQELTAKSRSTVCRATTILARRGFIVPCAVPCEGGALRTWRYRIPTSRLEVEPEESRRNPGQSDRAAGHRQETVEPHVAHDVEHATDGTSGVPDAPRCRGRDVPATRSDQRIEEDKKEERITSTTQSDSGPSSGSHEAGTHAWTEGARAYVSKDRLAIEVEFECKPSRQIRDGLLGLEFRYVRRQGREPGCWVRELCLDSVVVAMAIWRSECEDTGARGIGAHPQVFDPVRWAADAFACDEGELRDAVGCIRDVEPAEADTCVASAVLRLRARSRTV